MTVGNTDPIGKIAANQMIADGRIRSVWHTDQTESTNSVALADARRLLPELTIPRLYIADRQTAGRGRHGRTWQSDETSLTFSLLLNWKFQNDTPSRLLSMAVGVGIARAIEFDYAPIRTSLKWPNDVLIGGGKVAGILLEANVLTNHVIAGVGINVGSAPDLSQQPDANPTRSISSVVHREVHRYRCMPSIVNAVLDTIDELRQGDESEIIREFRSRCLLTGQMISFASDGITHQGRCLGVDATGSLRVETNDTIRSIISGEASLLRIQPKPQR
ncbi:biotin--[acetyl-CoA-carboxylase] ligase [Rubripirellula reticaptiva]|uniref:biotin--[acetyl-CoA-carboxylase] ligase n=1 Tax=Rubripirellula reticaptiva TaxID=2528013 RepID=UPI001C9600A5|nr:biotin--[acetyl-CoA-carboxylase] ligase [Rubripirellula reticaptiva]